MSEQQIKSTIFLISESVVTNIANTHYNYEECLI